MGRADRAANAGVTGRHCGSIAISGGAFNPFFAAFAFANSRKLAKELVEPATRGDSMIPPQWTSKSPQANRKTREGSGHVDRDAQFQYISDRARVSGSG